MDNFSYYQEELNILNKNLGDIELNQKNLQLEPEDHHEEIIELERDR